MKNSLGLCVGLCLIIGSVSSAKATNYSDVIVADNPFAYYRLNEVAVTDTVVDEMGTHHGSFMNSPTVGVSGGLLNEPTNTGVSFERAQTQYVELTTFGNYGSGLTEGFSIEYWLKSNDTFEVGEGVLGTANTPEFTTNLQLTLNYDEALRLYFRDEDWDRYDVYSYPGDRTVDILDNNWHHMVHVYDPLGDLLEERMLIYVDGIKQEVVVIQKAGVPDNTADFNCPMTLGAMNLRNVIRDTLNGSLDEVAFYSRPLTEQEIINHYESSLPTNGDTGCLFFDGVDSYVEIPDSPELSGGPGRSLTVEARFFLAGLPPDWMAIVQKYWNYNNKDWGFHLDHTGTFQFQKETWSMEGCQSGNWQISSSEPLVVNEWAHVAFVFDNVNDVVNLYLNGNLTGSRELVDCDLPDTDAVVSIGASGPFYQSEGDPIKLFYGYFGEVRIWNVARTEGEILGNMLPGNITGIEQGLVAYYDFLQGDDPEILYDRTGNSHNGDISNATWTSDADADGYVAVACGGDDCNDMDSNINPDAQEVCDDGADNDCDGEVDEDLGTTPTACGVGECASTGVLECIGGTWVDSCTAGTPSPETCDGLDNDCDGEVDEGIRGRITTCGVGECEATGVYRCSNGRWVDTCTPEDGSPEVCDGVDNDCNGEVDDGLSTDADGDGHYSLGSCLTPADDCDDLRPAVKPRATEGSLWDPTGHDSLDNDCDGATDRGDPDCALPCGTLPTAGSGTLGQMVLLLIPLAQIFLMKTLRRRKNLPMANST
jgi:hypothetical protein